MGNRCDTRRCAEGSERFEKEGQGLDSVRLEEGVYIVRSEELESVKSGGDGGLSKGRPVVEIGLVGGRGGGDRVEASEDAARRGGHKHPE